VNVIKDETLMRVNTKYIMTSHNSEAFLAALEKLKYKTDNKAKSI